MEFSRDLTKGSIVPIILSLVNERPMYGYEIVKVVNTRTHGLFEWKEGTLYPTLHRLQSANLVSAKWSDTSHTKTPGHRRKYYHITQKGKRELARRTDEWREFSFAVNACLLEGV